MSRGLFSYCSSQGILLLSILHYGVGESLLIHKRVGDSVELPGLSHLNKSDVKSVVWKYGGKDIAEYRNNVSYPLVTQFNQIIKMNPQTFSLTVRDLKLQDYANFVFTGEGVEGQIPSKVIILKVHEPVSNVVIHWNVQPLANHSCLVQMICNASGSSNLTYTWKRGNETYRGDQQMHFRLSPAEGTLNITCNASNIVSEKSASTTVSCKKTSPAGTSWFIKYIGITLGGAVVVILIVAVFVYNRKNKGKNTGSQMDNTIYADVSDVTSVKDKRSNSDVNPMSIYETVDDRTLPRQNPPQTVYDRITFGR